MSDSQPHPPAIDDALVEHLSIIARKLDGGEESLCGDLIDEFNCLADTNLLFADFQGVSGAEEHASFVRQILVDRRSAADPTLTRDQLVAMFRRVKENPSDDCYLQFVFSTVRKTFGDQQVSDLVFWPGEYFGDGDNSCDRSPEQMADAVLDRYHRRNARNRREDVAD